MKIASSDRPDLPRLDEPIPYDVVFPTIQLTFEDIEIKVPRQYDLFLRCRYGQYVNLPKRRHVCVHGVFKEYIEFMDKEDF